MSDENLAEQLIDQDNATSVDAPTRERLLASIERRLNWPVRFGWAALAMGGMALCACFGTLAVLGPGGASFLLRVGFSAAALAALAWSLQAVRLVLRGRFDSRSDGAVLARSAWWGTVILAVALCLAAFKLTNGAWAAAVICTGAVGLLISGILLVSQRIDAAELRLRQALLEVQLHVRR